MNSTINHTIFSSLQWSTQSLEYSECTEPKRLRRGKCQPDNPLPGNVINYDFGTDNFIKRFSFFQLKELSINPANFMSILSDKMLGKPYRWAQDLCGLEFLNTSSASTSTDRSYSGISNELVQLSVPKIVKQIRSRWQARLGLHSQISALGLFFFSLNN